MGWNRFSFNFTLLTFNKKSLSVRAGFPVRVGDDLLSHKLMQYHRRDGA